MIYFSGSKIIDHHFNVDNNKGELGICYDMIIGHDLMVELSLSDNFKPPVLQWDAVTVPVMGASVHEPRQRSSTYVQKFRRSIYETRRPEDPLLANPSIKMAPPDTPSGSFWQIP